MKWRGSRVTSGVAEPKAESNAYCYSQFIDQKGKKMIRAMDMNRYRGAVLLLAILAIASCGRKGRNVHDNVQEPAALSPDAVHLSEFIARVDTARCDSKAASTLFNAAADTAMFRAIFVSAKDVRDNEIHDCQRLIENSTLGPLVAILVDRSGVESMNTQNHIYADVMNYDTAGYHALNIKGGLSCLWIEQGSQANGSDWKAAIRKPTAGLEKCKDGSFDDDLTKDTVLTVNRMALPAGDGGEYPSTGRWMWDAASGSQFIGIRCGNAWCEIGKSGFQSTTQFSESDSIPGWYDEQMLSYMPAHGALMVSNIMGRIRRGVGAGSNPVGGSGAKVARMDFTGNDPVAMAAFATKFGFDKSAKSASILFRFTNGAKSVGQFRGDMDTNWHRSVLVNAHTQHAGKRAVRWAWSDLDEMAWFPCDVGCCRTED